LSAILNRRELQFDSVEIRNSRELVQSAVKKHKGEIRHAFAELKGDFETLMLAVDLISGMVA
jgi:predicted DNA-binding protein (UPF0278 family)